MQNLQTVGDGLNLSYDLGRFDIAKKAEGTASRGWAETLGNPHRRMCIRTIT